MSRMPGRRHPLARAVVAGLLLGLLLIVLLPGGVLWHWPIVRWQLGGEGSPWPTPVRLDLAVRLDPPGGFELDATVAFEDVRGERVAFLLNGGLTVERATDLARRELTVRHGLTSRSGQHREARVVFVGLSEPPADGRVTLHLAIRGTGESGDEGHDWRGILFVDDEQVRMCEQTVFHPLVPAAWGSHAAVATPYTCEVIAPSTFEIFVPGVEREREALDAERTRWRFESATPSMPSIVGGPRVRSEAVRGDVRLVTLLGARHADMADAMLDAAVSALDAYSARFGPTRAGSLGLFEMHCRTGTSYNWTSDGLLVFDDRALDAGFPREQIGHEVAHLWWGQAVSAAGEGERFLTESVSEWTSWGWLDAADARDAVASARRAAVRVAQDASVDLALCDVGFGVADYPTLAYEKGPLVLRYLAGILGQDVLDATLAELVREHAGGTFGLRDFEDVLARRAGMSSTGLAALAPWLRTAGNVVPTALDARWDEAAARLHLSIDANCSGDFDARTRVVLPVRVRRGAHVDELRVTLTGARTEVAFDAEARPASVSLDPDGVLPLARPLLSVLDGARLLASSPSADARDVAFGGDGALALTFDRPLASPDLDALSADIAARLAPGERAPALVGLQSSDDGRTLTLHTRPLLPDTTYVLPLRGVLHDAGGDTVLTGTLRFATAASTDEQPPRIVETWPAQDARVAAGALLEIRVRFSETMTRSTGFKTSAGAALREAHGWEFPPIGFGRWDDAQREVVFPIDGPLVPGTTYALAFGERWLDLSGNALVPFDFVVSVLPAEESP